MKVRLFFFVKVMFLSLPAAMLFPACGNDNDDPAPTNDGAWTLVFEDDFSRGLGEWNPWYGGAFNEEIQLYRTQQNSIEAGILKITAQRETVTGPTSIFDPSPKEFEYVSGRLESKELYGPSDQEGERTYRFQARIKLPAGKGMWPAFWTYGDPWPTQGEIDILEARGGEPFNFSSNLFYGPEPSININQGTEVKHFVQQDLTNTFNVYEMIWTADTIQILFNEEIMHTYSANGNNNIRNFFGKKQKVVLNTAVGGWFFIDRNSANYADNATMEVDWVKVFKK